MALTDLSSKVFQLLQSGAVISSTGTAILLASAGLLYYILPYLQDPHGLRQYPGPWAARFSCLWFARYVLVGQAQTCLKEAHEKYGPFVRIGPNDISICSPEALHEIYSHSSPALKSSFYDAFAPFGAARNVFNTRSRGEHARKRKPMSHTMAAKSLLEVLPLIYSYQRMLVKSWDQICGSATNGEEGRKGDCAWKVEGGKAWFNAMPWFNFIAFDVIGDLAFGSPFGMLTAAKAETPVAQSAEQAMNTFHANPNAKSMQLRTINAVETINDSSSFNSFLACLPVWIRPLVMSFPAFKKKLTSRRALAAMAATAVSNRLNNVEPVSRADFLSKLLDARGADGQPLSKPELSSEALALLVAGSDTTANSTAAIIYYLAQNPSVQTKLQAALDTALGPPNFSSPLEDTIVEDNLANFKNCEYLLNIINEGLRLNSTVGFGLPRVVPEGGMTVCGKVFNEGTVLSTPGLALHRMREVWGDDADLFVPERWERENKAAMQKAFSPFSVGPRACLGRNLAYMELQIFIGTLVHRYEFVLGSADQKLEVHEGFIRKPTGVYVGVRQRKSVNTSA